MVSALERQREENLRRNRELLLQLGLDAPIVPAAAAPRSPAKKKAAAPRKSAASKRRLSEIQDGDGEDASSPSPKRAAVAAVGDSPSGVRRSSRHAGKPRVSYTDEIITLTEAPAPAPVTVKAVKRIRHDGDVDGMDVEKEGRAERVGNRLGKRVYNPKTYGSIPGIEIGTWWETRAQCSTDAIHAPFVAGISAGPQGAYSIALSGGYEDDVDLGYAFTFTGSGGRDLKGTPQNRKNLRTAPQSSHQTWENVFNAALKRSVETKKPVRVIRGFKLQSKWAPATGYRYDGLYRVEKAWMEKGLNLGGFEVCKFALKRMDGQPALPKRDPGAAVTAESEDDDDGPEEEDADQGGEDEEKTAMDVDTATTTKESSVADEAVTTKATTPSDEAEEASGKQGDAAEAKPAADEMDVDATEASADKIDATTVSSAKEDSEDSVTAEAVSSVQVPPTDAQSMELGAAMELPVEDSASESAVAAKDTSADVADKLDHGVSAQNSTSGADRNVAAAPNDVATDAATVEQVAAKPTEGSVSSAPNNAVDTAVVEQQSSAAECETVEEVTSAKPTEGPVSSAADEGLVTAVVESASSTEIAAAAIVEDETPAKTANDPPATAPLVAVAAHEDPSSDAPPAAAVVVEHFPLSSLRDSDESAA